MVFGRWATKAKGWPVRVDLSEDKGEGESTHQHGVCPLLVGGPEDDQ